MEWALRTVDSSVVDDGLQSVSIDEPWALIERFADLHRDSGSEDERRAAEYMAERLRALGLDPVVHEPELYLSVPRSCSLRIVGAPDINLHCKVPAFSLSTTTGALRGELVEVSSGGVHETRDLFTASATIDRERVRGKIALINGYPMPKIVRQVEQSGALAAIFVNPGHAHEGITTTIWGTPSLADRGRLPQATVISIPQREAGILREWMGSGPAEVEIETDLFQGWDACPLVTVEIPGQSDDFVLIHGHYDSWHEGIGDNAVGDAALLEVARVCGQQAGRLRCGVHVAWWPGHSTARYGGSTWYADTFAIQLRDHCVAQIDVDSPGCRWATAYDEVMWMAEAEGISRWSIRHGAGEATEVSGVRPLRAGDYSFNNVGLSGFFMLLSNIPVELRKSKGFYPVGGCGGNSDAWHTEGDGLEVADRDNLLRDIRVYVAAVLGLATARFLPFDHRAAVDEISRHAVEYAAAADNQVDPKPVVTACAELRAAIEDLYAGAERAASDEAAGRGISPGSDGGDRSKTFDRAQMRLSRDLVPVNYAAAARFYHDPAMEVLPLPDLAVLRQWQGLEGDGDGRGFLRAQAIRGRNRVVDALKRVREAIAPTAG